MNLGQLRAALRGEADPSEGALLDLVGAIAGALRGAVERVHVSVCHVLLRSCHAMSQGGVITGAVWWRPRPRPRAKRRGRPSGRLDEAAGWQPMQRWCETAMRPTWGPPRTPERRE